MAEKEYIERDAVLRNLNKTAWYSKDGKGGMRKSATSRVVAYFPAVDIFNLLEETPAADVMEVVHSAWVWTEEGEADYDKYWVCPICDEKSYIPHNYCPNCGAKMDGGKNG